MPKVPSRTWQCCKNCGFWEVQTQRTAPCAHLSTVLPIGVCVACDITPSVTILAILRLQSRVNFHTNIDNAVPTVADATNFDIEPPTWRFSCRPEDVVTDTSIPKIAGCSGIYNWTADTDTCMIPYSLASTDFINLCLCDCGSPDKEAACHYGQVVTHNPTNYPFLRATAKQAARPAASILTQRNHDLFNTSGVYGVIDKLRQMGSMNMPNGTFGIYQVRVTHKCDLQALILCSQSLYVPMYNCTNSSSNSQTTINGRAFVANHGLKPLGLSNGAAVPIQPRAGTAAPNAPPAKAAIAPGATPANV